jgi:hypothetical protein
VYDQKWSLRECLGGVLLKLEMLDFWQIIAGLLTIAGASREVIAVSDTVAHLIAGGISGFSTEANRNTQRCHNFRKTNLKMNDSLDRDLGEQPITSLMEALGLKPHDIVAASPVQMTHKMVARAMKGRRLTANVKCKVRDALNLAGGTCYTMADLFNY